MRASIIMLLASGIASGLSCGQEDPIPTEGFEAEAPTQARRSFRPSDDLYDEEGRLREGDEVIVGLTMPRGLDKQEDRSGERRHVYFTNVPIEKVVAYFGPRLFTGTVDRVGDGAIYRGARPVNITENVVKLDVSVLPAGSRLRVEVVELPPMPVNPPSPAELERRWEEIERRLD